MQNDAPNPSSVFITAADIIMNTGILIDGERIVLREWRADRDTLARETLRDSLAHGRHPARLHRLRYLPTRRCCPRN